MYKNRSGTILVNNPGPCATMIASCQFANYEFLEFTHCRITPWWEAHRPLSSCSNPYYRAHTHSIQIRQLIP